MCKLYDIRCTGAKDKPYATKKDAVYYKYVLLSRIDRALILFHLMYKIY